MNVGKQTVIEFVRSGKVHRTVRWCSDTTMQLDIAAIKTCYASHGAEVLRVSMIESIEIEM